MSTDHDAKPKILLLAAPHLSVEGWGDDREAEAKEVVDRLSRFKPDVVAVEARLEDEHQVQDRYKRFLTGAESLGVTEIDQIAFRLAQVCNVSAFRGFEADWQLEWAGLRKLYSKEGDLARRSGG